MAYPHFPMEDVPVHMNDNVFHTTLDVLWNYLCHMNSYEFQMKTQYTYKHICVWTATHAITNLHLSYERQNQYSVWKAEVAKCGESNHVKSLILIELYYISDRILI